MKARKTLMKHRYNYGAVFVGYITFIGSYALHGSRSWKILLFLFSPTLVIAIQIECFCQDIRTLQLSNVRLKLHHSKCQM